MDLALILAHSGEAVQEAIQVLPSLDATNVVSDHTESSSAVSIHSIAYYVHIIAVIVGVIFATINDFKIIRAIKRNSIAQSTYDWIVRFSWIIRVAIVAILLSGGWFIYEYMMADALLELGHRFWFKMTVVLVLLVNGALIHLRCLPFLQPNSEKISASVNYSIVSLASWYFAGFGGLLLNRIAGLQTSYAILLISYIGVAAIALFVFNRMKMRKNSVK